MFKFYNKYFQDFKDFLVGLYYSGVIEFISLWEFKEIRNRIFFVGIQIFYKF